MLDRIVVSRIGPGEWAHPDLRTACSEDPLE